MGPRNATGSVDEPVSLLYYAGTLAVTIAIAFCLWHAQTREDYALLAGGFVYGYLLELALIELYETYTYHTADFVFALFDVPIHIAIAWTAILYSGWHVGTSLGLKRSRLPFFVALYALHIDLAMDVVAIRIPYWTWEIPGAWFGVPLNNFYGWFLVAFFFAGTYVALRESIKRPAVRVGIAVPASLGLLVVAVVTWSLLFAWSSVTRVGTVLGLISVGIVAVVTDDSIPGSIPGSVAAVSFVFHLYFLGVLLALGMYRQQPLILVVSLAMLGVSVVVHTYPHWTRRQAAGVAST